MFQAKFMKSQAKIIFTCNRLLRLKHSSEGCSNFRVLQETSTDCFHQSQTQGFLSTKQLPVPLNIEDLTSSERLKFSPERNRDINGSFISSSSSSSSSCMDLQSDNKVVDARIECYDCSGTINLNSAMQTSVPFPFVSRVKPIHLNMPGGQWRQKQKYVSEELNNVHHANTKKLNCTNGASVSLGSGKGTKNFYFWFPSRDLNSSSDLFSFSSLNSNQFRTFCTVKEKTETDTKNLDSNQSTPKISIRQKFKNLLKEYGPIALIVHICISLTSLLIIYLVVASGVNTSSFTKTFGGSEGALTAENATHFIVAFAIHKILAPVRFGGTLIATPLVAKKLRQLGIWYPKKQ